MHSTFCFTDFRGPSYRNNLDVHFTKVFSNTERGGKVNLIMLLIKI